MHIIAVISTVIIWGRRSLGRGSLSGWGLVWIIEGCLLFFKCLAVVTNYVYAFFPSDSSSSFLATCLQPCLSFTFTKCSVINMTVDHFQVWWLSPQCCLGSHLLSPHLHSRTLGVRRLRDRNCLFFLIQKLKKQIIFDVS